MVYNGEIKEVKIDGKSYPIGEETELRYSYPRDYFCSACHKKFGLDEIKILFLEVENNKGKVFDLQICFCKECCKDIEKQAG